MKSCPFFIRNIRGIAFAATIIAALLTSIVAWGAPGALDATFSGDGKVTTDFGSDDIGYAVALQPDGKILVVGASFSGINYDFGVARYNSNGSLDAGFDGDGKVITPFGSGPDEGRAIALQPDGKIIVAGDSHGSDFDFAIARYAANGMLDQAFGINGKTTTDFGSDEWAHAAALQSDGKIIVAGYTYSPDPDFALARYNSSGFPDGSFGVNGKVTTDLGGDDKAYAMVLQPDGKILVAGESSIGGKLSFALVRYNASGELDVTFSSDGSVTTRFGSGDDYGRAITLQADGKIAVAGATSNGTFVDFALARFNPDGSLDGSFSGDGKVTTAFGTGNDIGRAVVLQPDGKIIVAGSSYNGSDTDFAVARYTATGSLDTNFHFEGKVTTAIGSNNDTGSAVVLQPDARIIVAGSSRINNQYDFALVRYAGGSSKGFVSAAKYDGWTLETAETSSLGGSINATDTTLIVGDDAANKQFRSMLSFNTAGLPDTAVITKATLKIYKQRQVGDQNAFNVLGKLLVDIRRPYFGDMIGLQPKDFQALASRNSVGSIIKVAGGSSLYTATLSAAAYPYINLNGTTQFRLRFAIDDNGDMSADYVKFYSGDYATASARPQLIVEYYVP